MSDASREWQQLASEHQNEKATVTLRSDRTSEESASEAPTGKQTALADEYLRKRLGLAPHQNYRLIELAASGGQADLLLAEQPRLHRRVAIKANKSLKERVGDRGLSQEALMTAALQHPGVVPVHDAGPEHLVMKWIDGRSFEDVLDEAGDDPQALAGHIDILISVCETIAHAHAAQVIHADLKPANVMVGAYGEVYVVDWGLALGFGAGWDDRPDMPHVDRIASICGGTPAYLPPELARDQRQHVGPATDVWQLGALLYRVLIGHAPYQGEILDVVRHAARCQWQAIDPQAGHPGELVSAIERALHAEPERRGSVAELQEDLQTWRQRSAVQAEAERQYREARALTQQAEGCADLVDTYKNFSQAIPLAEGARSLLPDERRYEQGFIDLLDRFADRAIRAGDLALAERTVQRSASSLLETRRQALAAAWQHRSRVQQRRRLFRVVLVLAGVGLLALGVAAGLYRSYEKSWVVEQHRLKVQALLADGRQTVEQHRQVTDAALQRALARAYQALGFGVDTDLVRGTLVDLHTVATRWAIAQEYEAVARDHLAKAIEHGLDERTAQILQGDQQTPGTIAWLADADVRRLQDMRRSMVEQWQQILSWEEESGEAGWVEQAVVTITNWFGEERPQPLQELAQDLLRQLLLTQRPRLRELGLRCYERLLALYPDRPLNLRALLPLLADDDSGVRWKAALALARTGDHQIIEEALVALIYQPVINLDQKEVEVMIRLVTPTVLRMDKEIDAMAEDDPRRQTRIELLQRSDIFLPTELRNKLFLKYEPLDKTIKDLVQAGVKADFHSDRKRSYEAAKKLLDVRGSWQDYHDFSYACRRLYRYQEALVALEKGLQILGDDAKLIYPALGMTYHSLGQRDKAKEKMLAALRHFDQGDYHKVGYGLNSPFPDLFSLLMHFGRKAAAMRVEEMGTRQRPDAWTLLVRGDAYVQADLFRDAMLAYAAATDHWPAMHMAYHGEAQAWYKQGELDRALASADTALSILPRNPAILSLHGNILRAKGDIAGAHGRYHMAAALKHDYLYSVQMLLLLAMQEDRSGLALHSVDRLLGKRPPSKGLARLLVGLCLAEGAGDLAVERLFAMAKRTAGLERSLVNDILFALCPLQDGPWPTITAVEFHQRCLREALAACCIDEPLHGARRQRLNEVLAVLQQAGGQWQALAELITACADGRWQAVPDMTAMLLADKRIKGQAHKVLTAWSQHFDDPSGKRLPLAWPDGYWRYRPPVPLRWRSETARRLWQLIRQHEAEWQQAGQDAGAKTDRMFWGRRLRQDIQEGGKALKMKALIQSMPNLPRSNDFPPGVHKQRKEVERQFKPAKKEKAKR